jgi:hypothetical protein
MKKGYVVIVMWNRKKTQKVDKRKMWVRMKCAQANINLFSFESFYSLQLFIVQCLCIYFLYVCLKSLDN